MTKTIRAMRKTQTHFEQVPLDVVKTVLGAGAGKRVARPIAKPSITPKAAARPR